MNNNNKAFTIIEVVLVLAVAGLIFLVVFAAVPRLQASRRDNQRKSDARDLYALAIEFNSNTGLIPNDVHVGNAFPANPSPTNQPDGAFAPYVTDDAGDNTFKDPSTGAQYVYNTGNASTMSVGMMRVRQSTTGTMCSSGGVTNAVPSNNSKWALLMKLERGHICIDNQ